jgi:NAD(P)-dependent dehydrogenase (short-subunit alcohol dehydrogenase family)
MRARNWGRIVNVSSGIVANPGGMIGANTYTGAESALEAHSLNLAAELAGTGITVNVYRPGRVDTAMQAWIRGQDPVDVGGGLVDRFAAAYQAGELITPAESAAALVSRLSSTATGQIWDVADVLPTGTES